MSPDIANISHNILRNKNFEVGSTKYKRRTEI